MHVKKFTGETSEKAIAKVREELGPNAIILHEKEVTPKGFFRFFKKPLIEVVAAKDDRITGSAKKKATLASSGRPKTPLVERKEPSQQLRHKAVKEESSREENPQEIKKELEDMKAMIHRLMDHSDHSQYPKVLQGVYERELVSLYQRLEAEDVEKEIIQEILEESKNAIKGIEDEKEQKRLIHEVLKDKLEKKVVLKDFRPNSKNVIFVGPTGVGKTTTIAKLAARYSLEDGKKIGLISADTYRIAAVEQLKIYSEILNLPLKVIYAPEEMKQALAHYENEDLVLIDTAGRSHRNKVQLRELKELIDEMPEKEVYLVLSATSSKKDLKEILGHYSFLEDYKIIFTKTDEASTYGNILNSTIENDKRVLYLTNGQSVPDDIESASVENLIRLFTKEA